MINPNPIPCTVQISLKPKNKSTNFPFHISEKQVHILPLGKSSLILSFSPTTCDLFNGIFEAVVQNGIDTNTNLLKFEVEGSAVLPIITVFSIPDSKAPISTLNFGRIFINTSKERSIAVSNDTIIPAQIQLTWDNTKEFSLLQHNALSNFIIPPQSRFPITCRFSPKLRTVSHFNINIKVVENPKASLSFSFNGEGYKNDVIFIGEGNEDADVVIPDTITGERTISTFQMKNISTNHIRFQWAKHPDFEFSPSIGHLHAQTVKNIKVTFQPQKTVKYPKLKINCQWCKIKYSDDEFNHPFWDNSETISRTETRIISSSQEKKKKINHSASKIKVLDMLEEPPKTEDVRIFETKPEPPYTKLPVKCSDLSLIISTVADTLKFNVDISDLQFIPTMMYMTRSADVKFQNQSQIKINYQWICSSYKTLGNDITDPSCNPFSISPATGIIEGGQILIFKVEFSPKEVDDYIATYHCNLPFSSSAPISLNLSGLSKRPVCHVNIPQSNYLNSNFRPPEFISVLPDDTKILEIFSKKVGIGTTKKVEIINPTSSSYEITFEFVRATENSAIKCKTSLALISSGKNNSVIFSYKPQSNSTVESLWKFQIPSRNIVYHVLVVGRISGD